MEPMLTFKGKILFLSCAADAVRRQLAGECLSLGETAPLRDNISTDEITPATTGVILDERLGGCAHTGFTADGQQPICFDAIRKGGVEVIVAGKRYGKGSSREFSPLAEKLAGIRLVIAESFEFIYRQNCDNIGVLTSTDFSLVERISRGDAIPLAEFLAGRDAITQDVIRAGGLLAFSKAQLTGYRGKQVNILEATKPRTLVEKIIARRKVLPKTEAKAGEGMFLSADWRFSHDYFTGMAAQFVESAFGADATLERADEIIAFQDHLVLAHESAPHIKLGLLPEADALADGHNRFAHKYPVRAHGQLKGERGSEGICHALMAEKYALPGQVVTGTDSHTPHSGALGCLAFGAGATDIANAWVTGLIRCKMPEVVRVEIAGRLAPGMSARDIVQALMLADCVRQGRASGCVFEYGGPAVEAMSVDERSTLTNMMAEIGGFTGIVPPDALTVKFLRERRGVDFTVEDWMRSDTGATYKETIHIDCGKLTPLVARPGDPGQSVPLSEVGEIKIDIALGGSCTGGKREDFDYYNEVFGWARQRGLRVAPGTRLYLQFGTLDVRDYCENKGYTDTFKAVGAELIPPGCGACANCGPGQSTSADEVTVSSINRNFPGRSGPGKVWLASPYTVAASALAGKITSFAELQATASTRNSIG
jgi:3-isopropylmalate/(R)-2-methylmalate dehydratase large subunit